MPTHTFLITDVKSYMLFKGFLEEHRNFLFDSIKQRITCYDSESVSEELIQLLDDTQNGEYIYAEVLELLAELK